VIIYSATNVPETVNVATLQPPAGAGNVVTVLVPGVAEIAPALPGALIITIPEPPLILHATGLPVPPPPPPVLVVPASLYTWHYYSCSSATCSSCTML
jgi:hypothetical protein